MSVTLALFLVFTAGKLAATIALLRRPRGRRLRRRLSRRLSTLWTGRARGSDAGVLI